MALEGLLEDGEPVAQAPPEQLPDESDEVLQTIALMESAWSGSTQFRVNVTCWPGSVGSGLSVAKLRVGTVHCV